MRMMAFLTMAAALMPSVSGAAPPASAVVAPVEHRLSDVEIEKVLDAAALKREARELSVGPSGPHVHGEVGFEIGTGGYRSVFGTAVLGLPNDGFAAVTFGTSDFGRMPRYERRRER